MQTWRGARWALPAIWLCFLVRGVFYAAALPLWEGYDEYSHFAYVQHVSVHGSIPIPGVSGMSREVAASLASAPLPWTQRDTLPGAISYDSFWSLPPEVAEARIAALRKAADGAGRQEDPDAAKIYESQQPPLYYWLMAPILGLAENWSLPARVFLLRSVSLLLCSLSLPLGFAIARRVFGSDAPAIGAMAIVALMPEGMIDLARVGNESLALLVYALLAYACVRMLGDGPNLRNAAWIGLALGCGLLTKTYFLTAIPAVSVAFALTLRRPGTTWRRAAALLGASLSIAVLPSFWWYLFIHRATGDFTGQVQSAGLRGIPWSERLYVALRLNWLRALDTAMFSHIWFGGWSFLQVRSWMYDVFYAVWLAALAGLIALWLRSRVRAADDRRSRPIRFLFSIRVHPRSSAARTPSQFRSPVVDRKSLFMLAVFEACFCGSLAYHVTVARLSGLQPMTNGWYLYCLVFAEIILVCAGLMALLPLPQRVWAPVGLAGLFAALDLYGMNFLLLPYYLGWTAHSAGGRLQSFHPGQIWRTGLPDLSWRVLSIRPYLGAPAEFAALWVLYLAATVTCLAVALHAALAARAAYPQSAAAPAMPASAL